MQRERIIEVPTKERDFLKRAFRCSDVTVYDAVKYRKNNELHRRIRKLAIERGNPQKVVAPEFDTVFVDEVNGVDGAARRRMTQSFANGAELVGWLDDGVVEVRDKDGEIRGRWQNPAIKELKAIQEVAMSL